MPLKPQGSTQESNLSPNRVRSDFDVDTVNLYRLFASRSVGYLPLISPITSPESPLLAARSLQDEVYESVSSAGVSPATSMSITDRAAELQLMTPPLIPLPETINVQTNPGLLLQLTTAYQE